MFRFICAALFFCFLTCVYAQNIEKEIKEIIEDANLQRYDHGYEIDILAEFGEKAIPILMRYLKDKESDDVIKKIMIKALGDIGKADKDFISILTQINKNSPREIREAAVYALGALEIKNTAIAKIIFKYTTDKDPNIRENVAKILANFKTKTVALELVKMLKDSNQKVQKATIGSLNDLGGLAEPAVEELLKILKNSIYLKESALYALKSINKKPKLVVPVLIKLAQQKSSIQGLAIETLAIVGKNFPEVIPVLLNLQQDFALEYTISKALANFGEKAIPFLEKKLASKNSIGTIRPLANLARHNAKALSLLFENAKRNNQEIKEKAQGFLKTIAVDYKSVMPVLTKALKDKDPTIRYLSLNLLRQVKRFDKKTLVSLFKQKDFKIRQLALGILANTKQLDFSILKAALQDRNSDIRTEALYALESTPKLHIAFAPFLIQLLNKEEDSYSASSMLEKMGEKVVPLLIKEIKSQKVQEILADMGAEAHKARPALMNLFEKNYLDTGKYTEKVVETLARVGGDSALLELTNSLAKNLVHLKLQVRNKAFTLLNNICAREVSFFMYARSEQKFRTSFEKIVTPAVLKALKSKDSKIKKDAIEIVSSFEVKTVFLPQLWKMLDEDKKTQQAVIPILLSAAPKDTLPMLEQRLYKKNVPDYIIDAFVHLMNQEVDVVTALQKLSNNNNSALKKNIAKVLMRFDVEGLSLLLKLSHELDASIKSKAIQHGARVFYKYPHDASLVLKKALKNKNSSELVIKIFIGSYKSFNRFSSQESNDLILAIASHFSNASTETQKQMLYLFKLLGKKAIVVVDSLAQNLSLKEPELHKNIVIVLENLGVISPLIEALQGKSKNAAFKILQKNIQKRDKIALSKKHLRILLKALQSKNHRSTVFKILAKNETYDDQIVAFLKSLPNKKLTKTIAKLEDNNKPISILLHLLEVAKAQEKIWILEQLIEEVKKEIIHPKRIFDAMKQILHGESLRFWNTKPLAIKVLISLGNKDSRWHYLLLQHSKNYKNIDILRSIGSNGDLCLPLVASFLKHANLETRRKASIIAKSAPQPTLVKLLPALAKALLDADPLVRKNAIVAMHMAGEKANSYLAKALNNPDPFVCHKALLSLTPSYEVIEKTFPYLKIALKSKHPKVLTEAISRLGKYKEKAIHALPRLLELLETTDISLVEQVMQTLIQIGSPAIEAEKILKKIIQQDNKLKVSALATLGAIGAKADDKVLLQIKKLFNKNLDKKTKKILVQSLGQLSTDPQQHFLLLQKLFKEEEKQIQIEAIKIMATYGEKAINVLATALVSKEKDIRNFGAMGLATIGKKAIPILLKAFEQKDIDYWSNYPIKYYAAIAFGEIGEYSTAIAKVLIQALQDENKNVKEKAAWALGQIKAKEAVPGLLKLCKWYETNVSISAIKALGEIGDPAAIDILVDKIDNKEAKIALAKMSKQSIPKLLIQESVFGGDEDYSADIEKTLEKMPQATIAHMEQHLNDIKIAHKFPKVLCKLGTLALPLLAKALKNKNKTLRYKVAKELISLKEKGIDLLLVALEDKDKGVRGQAAWSLLQLGDQAYRAVPKLVKMVKEDPDSWCKAAAVAALEKIAKPNVKLVDVFLQVINDKENNVLRRHAVSAIATFSKVAQKAIPALLQRLQDSDITTRTRAIEALQKMQVKKAIPVLLEVVKKDKSSDVRLSALWALVEMKYKNISKIVLEFLEEEQSTISQAIALEKLAELDPKKAVLYIIAKVKQQDQKSKQDNNAKNKEVKDEDEFGDDGFGDDGFGDDGFGDDKDEFEISFKVLQKIEKLVVPALIKVAQENKESIAKKMLAKIREKIITTLILFLADKNPQIAIELLTDTPKALPLLQKAIKHSSANIRKNALTVIGQMNIPMFVVKPVIVDVIGVLEDKNVQVKNAAMEVLVKKGDQAKNLLKAELVSFNAVRIKEVELVLQKMKITNNWVKEAQKRFLQKYR